MFSSKEVTDYSDIKLIDFGLSKHKPDSLRLLSTVVGKYLRLKTP